MFKFRYRLLLIVLFVISCERGTENKRIESENDFENGIIEESITASDLETIKTKQVAEVEIFIENSLSMYGYLPSVPSDYKTAFYNNVLRILSLSNNSFGGNNSYVSIINQAGAHKKVFRLNNISGLNSSQLQKKFPAGIGNSPFHEVIEKVVQNHEEDKITLLMADYIHSPNGSLSFQELEIYITDTFLKANREGKEVDVKVYRFLSDFNGIYYDINDAHINGIRQRPYFIFVFANNYNSKLFEKEIGSAISKENDNFTNSLSLYSREVTPAYSFLLNTAQRGVLLSSGMDGDNIISLAYKENNRSKNGFQIPIALDFESYQIEDEYLGNINNYSVSNSDFRVSKIGKVSNNKIYFPDETVDAHPSDLKSLEGKTHVVVLETSKRSMKSFNISLVKRLPEWISDVSINDDRDILNKDDKKLKTLGFKYIPNGIFIAQSRINPGNSYFEIVVNINRGRDNGLRINPIMFIFGLLLVLIVLIVIKNNERK